MEDNLLKYFNKLKYSNKIRSTKYEKLFLILDIEKIALLLQSNTTKSLWSYFMTIKLLHVFLHMNFPYDDIVIVILNNNLILE